MVSPDRMSLRPIGGCIVLIGLFGTGQTTSTASLNPATLPDFPVLNLRLTVSKELPNLSRTALVREADTIWREGHLRLRWLAGDANPDTGMTLRVVVTARAAASTIDGHRWAVGELLRFDRTGAIAVASITGAQRIVDESQPHQLLNLELMSQHRLGVRTGEGHRARDRALRAGDQYPRTVRADARKHRRAGIRRSPDRHVPSRPRGAGTPRGACCHRHALSGHAGRRLLLPSTLIGRRQTGSVESHPHHCRRHDHENGCDSCCREHREAGDDEKQERTVRSGRRDQSNRGRGHQHTRRDDDSRAGASDPRPPCPNAPHAKSESPAMRATPMPACRLARQTFRQPVPDDDDVQA